MKPPSPPPSTIASTAAESGKTVHLIPADAAIKRLCFDEATGMLRPNLVLVDRQGAVVFEINELGLKGAARDPSRRLGVVWGDSVVFGIRWSWPCLLDALAPGYQFLNGGIEGDPYDNILRRAIAFNRAHPAALNILMLGWHPMQRPSRPGGEKGGLISRIGAALRASKASSDQAPSPDHGLSHSDNQRLRADLLAFLQAVPNTVLATMPTALNRTIVGHDLSPFFTRGDRDTAFNFAGDAPYSVELQRYLFDHISRRNAVVREVAQAGGARLVDLAAEFDTESLADFRADFHDVLHLRPRAYPKAAAALHAGIEDLL